MVKIRRRRRLRTSIPIELIKYLGVDLTARSAAELTGVDSNTAILFFISFARPFTKKLSAMNRP